MRISARTAYAVVLAVATLLGESRLIADSPAAIPSSIEDFDRYLEAGEFAPALRLARQQPEATKRDAWLTRLAQCKPRPDRHARRSPRWFTSPKINRAIRPSVPPEKSCPAPRAEARLILIR